MSTYLAMWNKIHATPVEDRTKFIAEHSPAKGIDVDFFGETYFDVDLLEALRNSLDTFNAKLRKATREQELLENPETNGQRADWERSIYESTDKEDKGES